MVNAYNPDVLNCIANLSNDEVFTPPELANKVLDLLPQELFRSKETTFLDPFTKSGVFLREIVKRLDRGLQDKIPDRQQRIDHILHRQVFGIAITELTSLLARRSVYCSKYANSPFSISTFDTPSGNILYKNIRHTWENGKCKYCGASQAVYDRGTEAEQYAYMFIHTDNPNKFFPNMKFDVIVGNPPYQLNTGGSKAQATPLYDKFFLLSKKLAPRYISLIIPSRWFAGGFALDNFRDEMISDKHIRHLRDYINSADCFGADIQIKGGVCYFLWDREHEGSCHVITNDGGKISESTRYLKENDCSIFIRRNEGVSILKKVLNMKEKSFDYLVSGTKPFGFATNYYGDETKSEERKVMLYGRTSVTYVSMEEVTRFKEYVDKYKVFISGAYGAGENFPHQIINKPFVGQPQTCCTETFIMIGPFDSLEYSQNVISYMSTRFMRFLIMLKKASQHTLRIVYQFVPLQDFSHPWTDEMLYKKYGLTPEEIAFIESMIRPME